MERIVKSFDQMLREHFGPEMTGDTVVQELAKAFSTGMGTAPATLGSADQLQLLNLDATLTSVLFTQAHLKMFNFLPRVPSPNALYQWNRRDQYGSERGLLGFPEGGTPVGGKSQYERATAQVRYLGVRRGITHQLAVAGMLGGYQLDPVEEEHRNGTMELLIKLERMLMFGDSAVKDENGNTVNYGGLLNQIAGSAVTQGAAVVNTPQVVDLRGKPMHFADFEEAAFKLYNDGLVASFENLRVFMNPYILSDLSKQKLVDSVTRRMVGSSGPVSEGARFNGYDSDYGHLPFEPWLFMEPVKGNKAPTVDDPGAPSAPSAGLSAVAGANAASLLPGTVPQYYGITSFNSQGESAMSAAQTATPTAGQQITVSWTKVAATCGYRVYRGLLANLSDAKWVATIPQPAGATGTYVDVNQNLPGTGYTLILERSPENVVIPQMTPLVKFPLAVTSTTVEFLLLLYHTLTVKVPERMIVYKNVGRWDASTNP